MAKQEFVMWDNELVTAATAGVTADGVYELLVSSEVSNTSGLKALMLVIQYDNSLPSALPFGFEIDCVVEGKFNSHWIPIATQFSGYNRPYNGKTRILTITPNLVDLDPNVEIDTYYGGAVQARTSRSPGTLPAKFRARVILNENDFGGPGAFQSVVVSGMGEAHDV